MVATSERGSKFRGEKLEVEQDLALSDSCNRFTNKATGL